MCQEVIVYLLESMSGLYIPERDKSGIERMTAQLLVLDHCLNDGGKDKLSRNYSFQIHPFEAADLMRDFSLKELTEAFLRSLSGRMVRRIDLEAAVLLFDSLEAIEESGISLKCLEELIPEIRVVACVPVPGNEGVFCGPLFSSSFLQDRRRITQQQLSLGNCYNCPLRQCLSSKICA